MIAGRERTTTWFAETISFSSERERVTVSCGCLGAKAVSFLARRERAIAS